MTEANSPYFGYGREDGLRDMQLITSCPARRPVGWDPEREWSWMYKRGYASTFNALQQHRCTRECERRRAATG